MYVTSSCGTWWWGGGLSQIPHPTVSSPVQYLCIIC